MDATRTFIAIFLFAPLIVLFPILYGVILALPDSVTIKPLLMAVPFMLFAAMVIVLLAGGKK